jgi:hypothetical protein
MTTDGEAARAWLTGHLDAGIEGVVAKRLDHGYLPERRAWRKVKTRTSAEAVVGGVLGPLNTPVALVLGRRDEAGPPAGGRAHRAAPTRRPARPRRRAAPRRPAASLALWVPETQAQVRPAHIRGGDRRVGPGGGRRWCRFGALWEGA